MGWTKMVKIISIPVVLLIILFATFTLLNGLWDTSSAPFYNVGGKSPDGSSHTGGVGDTEKVGISDISTISNSTDYTEPDYISPVDNGFLTVKLDELGIFRGDLILINYAHSYEIPPENDLVNIAEFKTSSYRVKDSDAMLSGYVIEALNEMMDDFFAETGRDTVTVVSAFRDYKKQQEVLDEYIELVGRSEAGKWAAKPGHSEHHAGLALDFGDFSGGTLRTFNNTGVNEWFFLNSCRYGFIPRYPSEKSDITKTAYEPWHFRYVGLPHASFIQESGLCFEEYIEHIMSFTSDDPFTATFNNNKYEVYFTRNTKIRIPFDHEFYVSGNNIDGFIVTIKY